jgi:membrane associated rhomboid family serine protease
MSIVFIIIIATCLYSYYAWQQYDVQQKSLFIPYQMYKNPSEYYRFVSCGFIHADGRHLIFNMLTLFFFGMRLATLFGPTLFIVFYLSAIAISGLVTFFKNKYNPNYAALGASGAVSAVMFSAILFDPWMMINGFIPGFIYAIGYVVYSVYMNKQQSDNIGHETHLYGALYGWLFTFILFPSSFGYFIKQIGNTPF